VQQRVIDFISGLVQETGVDRREFYRFIGSLELPEDGYAPQNPTSAELDQMDADLAAGRITGTPWREVKARVFVASSKKQYVY
jgi:hypothetical protein